LVEKKNRKGAERPSPSVESEPLRPMEAEKTLREAVTRKKSYKERY
jgi:hypothetical protein